MYQIEKNIPIPKSKNIYPFSEMEIGDSFLITMQDGDVRDKFRARIAAAIFSAHKNTERRFTSRLAGNDLRIWRLK